MLLAQITDLCLANEEDANNLQIYLDVHFVRYNHFFNCITYEFLKQINQS